MLITWIKNRYNTLTEAEKKLALYIMENPADVIRMTVKEFSEKCSVAPSAVIRLCKDLELDGFSELKIRLAGDMGKESRNDGLPSLDENDSTEAVFRKVFQSGINTLRDTLEMMDFEKIHVIAEKMLRSKRVVFFGVGTSSVIATDAQYRFAQLGISASACTDILFMNVTAINLGADDLAIFISHSGRTCATVDAMRNAKKSGAATIAITSFTDSPLYKECDNAVSVFSDEDNYPVEAVSARVAHTCIIDAFMMTLATMKHDSFAEHIASRNEILRKIRY